MPESVNTSIRIPAELHDRLRQAATQERRSVNQLIQLAIEDWLRGYEREGYPGKITSTRTTQEWANIADLYDVGPEQGGTK